MKKIGLGVLAVIFSGIAIWGIKFISSDNNLSIPLETVVNIEENKKPIPEMVFVEGGSFIMGCEGGRDINCRKEEQPSHKVLLEGFSISKYEVTVEEYLAFADITGYYPEWLEKRNEYH
ncbi:MAG: SUMF1/EgtB/PvdO family nonheme iron enzyme, partial [Bacteroidota bacterium]